jgi:hypothetical protein
MFKIIATGLLTFALVTTPYQWGTFNKGNPWIYKSPTETKHLEAVIHCYQWLPTEIKQTQEVLKKQNKKNK